jgi:hypothetical protein
LRAADDQGRPGLCCIAKPIKLGSAELAVIVEFPIATTSLDRAHVKAHRVFARAEQDGFRLIRHTQRLPHIDLRSGSGLAPAVRMG